MDRKKLGYEGEKFVSDYLVKKGYTIIKSNYTIRGGEIDLIAQKDEFIVFVEVKTRAAKSLVRGVEAVTRTKQERIIRTAQSFCVKNDYDLQPRFDVAEVVTENNIVYINYIENAFDTSDTNIFF